MSSAPQLQLSPIVASTPAPVGAISHHRRNSSIVAKDESIKVLQAGHEAGNIASTYSLGYYYCCGPRMSFLLVVFIISYRVF